jgi:nicotinamide phosphoribosyltransferase
MESVIMNLPLYVLADSYKLGHIVQYPEGTTKVYSNFTPRSARHFLNIAPGDLKDDTIVAYGMYDAVRTILNIDDYFWWSEISHIFEGFYTPFSEDTKLLRQRFDELDQMGFLPLEIKALPEGTLVKPGTPVLTITNTDGRFAFLVNFLEDLLSNLIWKPMTVATTARLYRKLFEKYAELTGAPSWFVDFQGHDFSMRGMSGPEDAARSGVGHLLFFTGTDNLAATYYAQSRYVIGDELVGASVPATEHSVMCAGGQDTEMETYRRLIEDLYPSGIVAIVSDTWDFFKVLTEIAPTLKDKIMGRDGKVVFRPDSGDPVDIVAGTAKVIHPEKGEFICDQDPGVYIVDGIYYWWTGNYSLDEPIILEIKDPTPQMKGAIEVLWDEFGGVLSNKGYKMLDEHVGLIYGDSITLDRASRILERLERKGFASSNIVFGIGSFTYQHTTRDTLGCAMKATYAVVSGEERELEKKPVTDPTKKSHRGLLRVNEDGSVQDQCTWGEESGGLLRTIYKDGELADLPKFSEIRVRAQA